MSNSSPCKCVSHTWELRLERMSDRILSVHKRAVDCYSRSEKAAQAACLQSSCGSTVRERSAANASPPPIIRMGAELAAQQLAQHSLQATLDSLHLAAATDRQHKQEIRRDDPQLRDWGAQPPLLLLAGCTRDLPSPEQTVTVSGCPVVTPCTLNPAAPTNNDGLSDDSDYLLSAWAECAAKVDSVIQYRTRPVQRRREQTQQLARAFAPEHCWPRQEPGPNAHFHRLRRHSLHRGCRAFIRIFLHPASDPDRLCRSP